LLGRIRPALSLWRRTLVLIFAAAPRQAAAMAAIMLLQAFLPVGTLWASRGVVNAAARAVGLAGPATGDGGLPLCGECVALGLAGPALEIDAL